MFMSSRECFFFSLFLVRESVLVSGKVELSECDLCIKMHVHRCPITYTIQRSTVAFFSSFFFAHRNGFINHTMRSMSLMRLHAFKCLRSAFLLIFFTVAIAFLCDII